MDLSLTFLGTGGSVPSARRSTAAVLARRGGDRILFDCGEGTQRQMQRSTGLIEVKEIFFTHFHLDHVLGLPGLLKTWDLQDRIAPLVISGPPGLRRLWDDLRPLVGRLGFEVSLRELDHGEDVDHGDYVVRPYTVSHRVKAFGYVIAEEDRPGRFDPDRATELGVEPGPDFGRLQHGEAVDVAGGETVQPDQVVGEDRPGRTVVLTGDTAPCDATLAASYGGQLLVHDATFADEDRDRAQMTGHSTARQAARLAAEAEVELLALVHISSRYHVGQVLDEAREEFEDAVAPRDFDLIEVPLPERGGPELVRKGALPDHAD
ncbi:MAG: ribonuclease Z [Solirubrobacterales bacterium]